jgi:outer membrane assembly lipoprotein YfgL
MTRQRRRLLAALPLALLAGCSAQRAKPTPLQPLRPTIAGRQVWTQRLDGVPFPLVIAVRGERFVVAGGDGSVMALQADTGAVVWRGSAGAALTAGVGSDGRFSSVVTRANEVVTLEDAAVRWRARLPAGVSSPPLVAGERVFVMSVDRAVHAFDALDGRRLWVLQRAGDPLTLAQAGVLMPWRNLLLVGQGARLAAVDSLRGNIVWELPLASPRGTNEVERLSDLVGPAVRSARLVCARSFQQAVGCVDVEAVAPLWSRVSSGTEAVGADADRVYGADAIGRITAWRTSSGELLWTNESFLHRGLGGLVAVGPTVAFGDAEGFVHWLAADTGTPVLRLPTDGSPVVGVPALAGTTLLAATRRGGLFAFRPV